MSGDGEKIAKEIQMKPKKILLELYFLKGALYLGKAQQCNKDPCCVSDIDTNLSFIVGPCAPPQLLFCNELPHCVRV